MFKKSTAAQRLTKLALAASVAVLGAASAPSFAASTTAQATANVLTPIAINKTADLVFGKFIASGAGSVTISTSGARTSTGVTEVAGITPAAATFDITGQASTTYSISTAGTSANLTSGSDTMALALVSDLTGGGATSGTVASGTLSGGGAQTVYVGGVLTVGAAQPAGSYSGTISMAVDYN